MRCLNLRCPATATSPDSRGLALLRWTGYFIAALVIGIADLGFLFTQVLSGLAPMGFAQLIGPILWLVAVALIPFGLPPLRSHRA